jgi:cell division protein FtsQ
MRRGGRPSLRGSIMQTTGTVRMRPRENRLGFAARAGIAAGAGVLVIGFILWGWQSGWFHRRIEGFCNDVLYATQKAHFAVDDIIVEGRQHTNKDQLFTTIGIERGSPIFAFGLHEAALRIEKLPWVESVTIERRLPDTIFVRLSERIPLARWQHDNRTAVIDTQGKVLAEASPDQFARLPLLVGAGAPAEAKDLLDTLQAFPAVEQKITAAVRVSERRWDLHLYPKVIAKLPETEIADALKRLSGLISEQKILERDVVAIDLRVPDRLIIEEGSASQQQRPANGG